MKSDDRGVNFVRKSTEKKIEEAEQERRLKLLDRRIELARLGIAAYRTGKIAEAVTAFHCYIYILEDVKHVGEGGLMPSCFDLKRDMAEILMLSGIYWDLVKLYDRTSSAAKNREFLGYLEKYIIFSKDMPYQALCAQSLRKYIQKGRPVHITEFKRAYEILHVSRCFVVTSLLDVISPKTLPQLKKFRDQVLKKNKIGRKCISWYYRYGPGWAKKVDQFPQWMRKLLGLILDQLAALLFLLMNQ